MPNFVIELAVVIWPLVLQKVGEGLPLLSYGAAMLSLRFQIRQATSCEGGAHENRGPAEEEESRSEPGDVLTTAMLALSDKTSI